MEGCGFFSLTHVFLLYLQSCALWMWSTSPSPNNQGENDLRMTKVQQKISGCFRSMQRAKIFCRVRSYLCTCRKQGMTATQALTLLFEGKSPDFMKMDEA